MRRALLLFFKGLGLGSALLTSTLLALSEMKSPLQQPYLAQSCPIYNFYDPYTDHLIPSQEILALLDMCHLTFDGTATDLVRVTQQHWFRLSGKERWEVDEIPHVNREEFMAIFRRMGLIAPIVDTKNNYDYVIVVGASVSALKLRLNILAERWKQGLRCSKIEILCGERVLNPEFESEAVILATIPSLPWKARLTKFPIDEIEMAHWIVENVVWPDDMGERIEIVEVRRPGTGPNGRPGSFDTLAQVRRNLQKEVKPGMNCLIISSQPHAHYHFTQAQLHLADLFQLELAGNECPPDTKVSVILDAIARWVHTEFTQRLKHISVHTSKDAPKHFKLKNKTNL